MTCAKFLSIAALCLGLAMFAASARAAQPVSDYDLEPLLRCYGGGANQMLSSDNDDDNTPPETLQPIGKSAAASKGNPASDQVSPAIYSQSDDDSGQCDQQPSPTSSRCDVQTFRSMPHYASTSSGNSANHGVRPAMATSAVNSSSGSNDDSLEPSQGPYTRSIQSSRGSSSGAMNSWANYGDNNSAAAPGNSGQAPPEMIGPGMESSNSDDSCGCGSCDSCGGCCNDCCSCFSPCGCRGWYGGADYVLARPDFSVAQAFVKIVGSGTDTVIETDTMIQQKFDYRSSVRAFLGYRFDCGDEISFHYWNFNDGGTLVTPAPTDTTAYGGQFMTRANEPDQALINSVGLNMNVYDIDYSKCCCNPCPTCNPCCPVWTLKYSVGVRIADVNRIDNTFEVNPTVEDAPPPANAFVTAHFIGAGPRVGLEGRRYFNGCDRLSLFARTNFSLLLGENTLTQRLVVTSSDISPETTETLTDSHDRIIPVAEIELGGDWQMSNCLRLSAGYMFQAWWDLGEFEQISVTDFQTQSNANIMGFDGLFARVEYCF